jgi:hypothetical protein
MTPSAHRLVLLCGVTALLASGCGEQGVVIGQTSAVRSAQGDAQQASSTPVTFVSAASGPLSEFEPDAGGAVDPGREVWAVVFRGTFRGSCGPSPVLPATARTCPVGNSTIEVVVDGVTGDFILAQSPAGSG